MIGKTKCNIRQQHCYGNGKMSDEAIRCNRNEIPLSINWTYALVRDHNVIS